MTTNAVRPISVAEYHRLFDTGALGEDDRVELIDGQLVTKMPQSPRHRATLHAVLDTIGPLAPASWYCDSQVPITLSASEPEPDFILVRGQSRQYLNHHPGPGDVGLLIEVAESSLAIDRGPKMLAYARDRIEPYWIVNLIDRVVEVYTDPDPTRDPPYRRRVDHAVGSFILLTLDGTPVGPISVDDLFP